MNVSSADPDSDNSDSDGPQTSGGNDTVNVPYSPPEEPPEVVDTRPVNPGGNDIGETPDEPTEVPVSDDNNNSGDFNGPQTSGGNDTVNIPYSPPEEPEGPIMRPREPSDGDNGESEDGPEHDLEDERTKQSSEGVDSGQAEPTPEAP